jgi:hypothetical protein
MPAVVVPLAIASDCVRLDRHRDVSVDQPRERGIRLAGCRASIAEEHDAGDVAGRQFRARGIECSFEVRPPPVHAGRRRRGGVHLRQLPQPRGCVERSGRHPEGHDSEVCGAQRCVQLVDPAGGRLNGRSRDTVRDVNQVHDRLPGRAGRNHRPRKRDRERDENERAQARLQPSLARIEVRAREAVREPYERYGSEEPECRRSGPRHHQAAPLAVVSAVRVMEGMFRP